MCDLLGTRDSNFPLAVRDLSTEQVSYAAYNHVDMEGLNLAPCTLLRCNCGDDALMPEWVFVFVFFL